MIKQVFFAGKFTLNKDESLPLSERLQHDYRSKLLDNPILLAYAGEPRPLGNGFLYGGTFYSEKASDGNYTSNDCTTVIRAEYRAVAKCDVFVAVLDESFSTGTVVEIEWALLLEKAIVLYYRPGKISPYRYKSEYWFVIADVVRRSNRVIVRSFEDQQQVVDELRKGEVLQEAYEL